MYIFRSLRFTLIAGSFLFSMTTPIQAGNHPQDEHGDAQHHLADSQLQLNHGEKWQTDTPLRDGMQHIYDAAMKLAPAYHASKLTQADANSLATHISEQVQFMVSNCKLEPLADGTLHVLIGELFQGAEALKTNPLATDGLPRIIRTLDTYPQYFDHPGWIARH